MARTDTLPHFLTDVADALRTKKGTVALIPANTFDTEITNLPSGADLQSKSITITNNGTRIISPDTGYDGIDSLTITTNVAGGSSGDYEYDNWISYGTSTPDATEYKYWLPVNTTSTNAPLRYVSNYKVADYYTGEFAELVDDKLDNTYKMQSSFTIGALLSDGSGNYYYASGSQNTLLSNVNVYKYTYTNQQMPSYECLLSSYSENFGNLKDKGMSISTAIYGCWTARNGVIYSCDGMSVYYWNNTSNTAMSWFRGYNSNTFLSSTYRGLGLHMRTNGNMILFKTNNTSVIIQNAGPSSSTTIRTVSSLSNMNSYSSMRIDDDNVLIAYKTSSFNLSNSTQSIMYNYRFSTDSWTQVTLPTNTGYMYFRYVIPANKYIFRFSNLPYTAYTLENGTFVEMGNGNLFNASIRSNYGAIGYMSGTTFRACLQTSNFSMKDTGGNVNTYNLNTGDSSSYAIVEGTTTKNYDFGHETLENYNSSDNVLLISNYQGNTPYQSYAFYPKPNSDIFLWLYRNGTTRFIYNKTEYVMQISVNGSWATTDASHNII